MKKNQRPGMSISKKLLTENKISLLLKNPHVKSVSPKGITYTDEFKRSFIDHYDNDKPPREIFEEAGFDVDIVGIEQIHSCSYQKNGLLGLTDTRMGNSGRTRERELTLDEKYAKLEAQNNLFKAENE